MGQMFKAVVGGFYGGNIRVFEYSTKSKCICTKLMEHSYINNEFVNNISALIYNNPSRVCWVGQYADYKDFNFNVPCIINSPQYEDIWGKNVHNEECEDKNFDISDKFLINYEMKTYINLKNYIIKSTAGHIIHPLPLLTAIGNDKGSGDFHKENIGYEFVGTWAWQLIGIQDKVSDDYTNLDIVFSEINDELRDK